MLVCIGLSPFHGTHCAIIPFLNSSPRQGRECRPIRPHEDKPSRLYDGVEDDGVPMHYALSAVCALILRVECAPFPVQLSRALFVVVDSEPAELVDRVPPGSVLFVACHDHLRDFQAMLSSQLALHL